MRSHSLVISSHCLKKHLCNFANIVEAFRLPRVQEYFDVQSDTVYNVLKDNVQEFNLSRNQSRYLLELTASYRKDTAVLFTYEFRMHCCTSLLSFHNHVKPHREEPDLLKHICHAVEYLAVFLSGFDE